ncbi:MAG: hypothetical protein HY060_14695 [Proteobacteria bacterium]|nr:hypothetical protein [Pseudomonadota bacterium]
MVDEILKPALTTSLRLHEIGDRTPYEISFARTGKSGGSFGFMQGDLAKGEDFVRDTFIAALHADAVDQPTINVLLPLVTVPQPRDPLTPAQHDLIDQALRNSEPLVDAMDQRLLATVYADLDLCLNAADTAGRRLTPKAQLYIAMWSNMTGRPDTLAAWLRGVAPQFTQPVPAAGEIVDGAALEAYLSATKYYLQNPKNLRHIKDCATAGVAELPAGVPVG